MASRNFGNLSQALAKAQIDFSAATFKALLVSSIPSESNLDTWVDRADVTNEVSGTGYTAGGFAVTASVGTYDAANNRTPITFSVTNPVLDPVSVTAVGMYIYVSTGTAANDLLVTYVEFAAPATSTNGAFNVSLSNPLYINV
jgi:hypothetical protein